MAILIFSEDIVGSPASLVEWWDSVGMTTDFGVGSAAEKGIGSGGTIFFRDFLSLPLFVCVRMGQARDWSSFLSEESKAREPSPLKAVANHLSIPGIISLGGG